MSAMFTISVLISSLFIILFDLIKEINSENIWVATLSMALVLNLYLINSAVFRIRKSRKDKKSLRDLAADASDSPPG